jgi:nitrate reductase assembly molybdenum cofactor insertion protein NarJ
MSVTVVGEGAILLETPEAVWDRIHSRLEAHGEVTSIPAAAAVRQMRNDDIAAVEAKYTRVFDTVARDSHKYPADTKTYASDEEMLRELGVAGL